MLIYLHPSPVSNTTKFMTTDVYHIKHENSGKEIITLKQKLTQFDALIHTACTCTMMVNARLGTIVSTQYGSS